jgi:hypothetical protein
MNRRRLIADSKEQARYCHDCGQWPAPVQWDRATRLCEPCAKTRRATSEGVTSVSR